MHRNLAGWLTLVTLVALGHGLSAHAAHATVSYCPTAAPPAAAPADTLAQVFSAATTTAATDTVWGMPAPSVRCVQTFCSTNANCTCPGSTCVNHVCTAGTGGGGGGGGGCKGPHTFCTTSSQCSSACPSWTCINNICQ